MSTAIFNVKNRFSVIGLFPVSVYFEAPIVVATVKSVDISGRMILSFQSKPTKLLHTLRASRQIYLEWSRRLRVYHPIVHVTCNPLLADHEAIGPWAPTTLHLSMYEAFNHREACRLVVALAKTLRWVSTTELEGIGATQACLRGEHCRHLIHWASYRVIKVTVSRRHGPAQTSRRNSQRVIEEVPVAFPLHFFCLNILRVLNLWAHWVPTEVLHSFWLRAWSERLNTNCSRADPFVLRHSRYEIVSIGLGLHLILHWVVLRVEFVILFACTRSRDVEAQLRGLTVPLAII